MTMPFELPEDFGALTNDALRDLKKAAFEASGPIADLSPDETTETHIEILQFCVDAVTAVDEELATRADRVHRASQLAGELSAAFAAEPDDADAEDDAPAEPEKKDAAVTAARATTTPRISALVEKPQPAKMTSSIQPDFSSLVLAVPGCRQCGYQSWRDVAKAAERRLSQYGAASQGRHGVAVIKRNFAPDLITDGENDQNVIDHAVDEKRLPGNSLVAAAGWCAPSQTVYDLCELECSDGMIDLPEVQIQRGGLRFTPGPDFASIFNGSGYFHLTEAQVIAGTTKPCMEIDCPAFTDKRLEVEGVCITGAILQRRGYPELVERFIRGAMVAHMHKLNAFKIAQIVAGSTVVDLAPPVDIPLDVTATSGLLSAIEMTVVDMKYRNRMCDSATIEIVLPFWARAVVRADLSRRTGVDLVNVSDDMMNAYFTVRKARVQYVYDWQDAFSGLATGPGGATALTSWPNTVFFLAYPAGTWLVGTDDTIRLDTIYDSTNLSQNKYTALFTEEGVLVAQVCNGGSRIVEVTFCGNGATSAGVAFACA